MEVLIIGGIAAGMSAAAKALRENKQANITLIEKSDYISLGACGLPYYLSDLIKDEKELYARTPQQMIDAGLNVLIKHEVLSVDFENKTALVLNLDTNKKFEQTYDKLLIATGASAIIPQIDGVYSDNVYTITKPDMVNKLKDNLDKYENIVIVGGGFIGVEVAEQLSALDKNVSLIQSNEYLMNGPFDSEFSEKIKDALIEANVKVYTNERVNEFVIDDNNVVEVISNNNKYKADAVIIAIGFRPNTSFLNNQLKTLDNGAILINKYGETSIKDVFAAGDAASIIHKFKGDTYIPLATYANKLGRIIGINIVSPKDKWESFENALGSSSIKVGKYEAAATGLLEKDAKALNLNYKTTLIETNNHASYYPNPQKIMIKLVYDADDYTLYGAQVFGLDGAVLRASAFTTAISANLSTKELGYIDYAYSPPFASTWDAINVAANTAK